MPPGRQDSEVTAWRVALACFLQRIEWPYDRHATGSWSLLHILPSPDLELNSLMTVIWLGKQPPAATELKHFLQISFKTTLCINKSYATGIYTTLLPAIKK
jgi:hypothetical protein